ncbi:unnamed protein product [Pseudo-nitzschia multistriata]|uniref:HSF-type DNA-binding domain-containing protein n=1 Tax=Pseudo-nitzschia multistriata TaxID=183589 RepID=A0A448Z0T6_9STRA|nr:unnamed protein product [Pseudo-nitzschia multistriata]
MHRQNRHSSASTIRSSIDMAFSIHSPEEKSSHNDRNISNNNKSGKEFKDFLKNLHRLLDEHSIGSSGQRIVSWNSDGLSFQIHDSQKFERLLLPLYFSTDQKYRFAIERGYESFLDRLRDYGFYRITNEGIYRDTFSHPLFIRGKECLSLRIESQREQQSQILRRNSWPMPPLQIAKVFESTTTSVGMEEATNPKPQYNHFSKEVSHQSPKPRKLVVPIKAFAAQSIDKPLAFRQSLQRRKRPTWNNASKKSIGRSSTIDDINENATSNIIDNGNNSFCVETSLTSDLYFHGSEDTDETVISTPGHSNDSVSFNTESPLRWQQRSEQRPTIDTNSNNVEPLDVNCCQEDDLGSIFDDEIAEALLSDL